MLMQIVAETNPSTHLPSDSGRLSLGVSLCSFFNSRPRAPVSQPPSSFLSKAENGGLNALAPQDRGAHHIRCLLPDDPGSTATVADPGQVDPGADTGQDVHAEPRPVSQLVRRSGGPRLQQRDARRFLPEDRESARQRRALRGLRLGQHVHVQRHLVHVGVLSSGHTGLPSRAGEVCRRVLARVHGREWRRVPPARHQHGAGQGHERHGRHGRAAINTTAKDYKFLYDAYITPANNLTVANSTVTLLTLAQVKETTEFQNFRAKLAFLAFGLEGSLDVSEHAPCAIRITMTVLTQLLVGMTDAEIHALIRASVRWNLGAKLESPSFTSTGSFAVTGELNTGLRVFNGQETAMRSLRAYDTDVHIISASPQVFVEEVGKLLGLGYMVPATNVWGVRFTAEDGKFSGKTVDNYPITWGPGKAEIVNKSLKPLYKGKAPVYSSGDSDGDCDMLDTVRDGIVHVNNRLKDSSTCIQAFYELSCKYFMSEEPVTKNKYLLQGQDKAIGSWITSGVTYTSNAVTNNACAAYKFLQG